MQIPPMNTNISLFHAGNSKSLGTSAGNRSTPHHNHRLDAQKVEVEAEEGAEEGAEMGEADYLLWQDQACSLRTDEPQTLNF
jgi:hypothetical protein